MALTERFNLTLTTKDGVTPAQIAEALEVAGLVDPELELVHVAKLLPTDIQLEPGSTRMIPVAPSPAWQGMRYYCQSCGYSFVDIPALPFPTVCPKCSTRSWSVSPPNSRGFAFP